MQEYLAQSPWILKITEYTNKPAPVLIVRERLLATVKDRGLIYGQSLRRCIPVIRAILYRVRDNAGVPLELQQHFQARITFRGDLPLGEEAGVKLALIFKLQERLSDMNRVELIARRVERFSREEAAYWLSRMTQYGEPASRWAVAGMRIMLGGQAGDEIQQVLDGVRR